MVNIGYSAPGVDMTAQGAISAREFRLESDGSAIRLRVEVEGALGRQPFALAGRTKNLRDRDFSVQGSWDAVAVFPEALGPSMTTAPEVARRAASSSSTTRGR